MLTHQGITSWEDAMGKGFCISLEGKTALVTGGARGIGAETCRQLATAGANVVINYSHSGKGKNAAQKLKAEIEGSGVEAMAYEADVSSEEEVKTMAGEIIERFGRIDILVNNAATMIFARFDELSYDVWKKVIDVNLGGAFLVTREIVPYMLENGGGNIIMISTNATLNGGGGGAHYPASKAGMEGLAKQLVREYSSRGIRVNIIQPAVIDTELLRGRYPSDEEIAEYGKSIPVGRVGRPVDVANAVVFLASDKASYICGMSMLVDGGRAYYK